MKASGEIRRWVARQRRWSAKHGQTNGVIPYLWDAPEMERKDANNKRTQQREKKPTEFDLS